MSPHHEQKCGNRFIGLVLAKTGRQGRQAVFTTSGRLRSWPLLQI
ncbi:unnamed protein product, partial [Brenthis ino]